ncbi:S8 family serine peptidase [Bacillus fonticola]|uniref:S8 family serine peptidase n=1 Tax=Bacillus fonticola TaxID=2728853 RepID=UPI001475D328|nr:S8 family serine peptidase [Bacillus fonticola]
MKRKQILATVAATALATSTLFVGPFSGKVNAASGELQSSGIDQYESNEMKAAKVGKAAFLFETSDVKIPRGIQKKLETEPKGNTLKIVQLNGPITMEERKEIEATGATIEQYIPDFAFVVDTKNADVSQLEELSTVEFTTAYLPLHKFDPQLFQKGASGLVKAKLYKKGGKVEEVKTNGLQELIEYSLSNDVLNVTPDIEFQTMNVEAGKIMNVPTARQNYGLDGSGQIVGVADTGLDNGRNDSSIHEAFRGKIESLRAWGRPNDTSDPNGHGTHVAGSVLGNGSEQQGMAPGARLVFQSIMDRFGGLGGLPSDLGDLFQQAYNDGARIHTNSWGASVNGAYTTESQSVDSFVWNNDMTILFAAGNDGSGSQTIGSPGTAKNAITVGASENYRPSFGSISDRITDIASFSSRGPTADGRVKPDVVAPGTYILSTRSSLAPDSSFWANYNSRYAYMGGTSMSTPLVAGTVALLRENFMENRNVTPKPSLIKAALIAGATDIGKSRMDQGWGLVDLENALNVGYVNESVTLQTGQSTSFTFNATSADEMKISLVWTDYPGNPSARYALVNDLDLVITSPSGKTYVGNDASAPYNNNWDGVNNVENIVIPTPENGTYTIEIQAYNVPSGSQDFSIAVVN